MAKINILEFDFKPYEYGNNCEGCNIWVKINSKGNLLLYVYDHNVLCTTSLYCSGHRIGGMHHCKKLLPNNVYIYKAFRGDCPFCGGNDYTA